MQIVRIVRIVRVPFHCCIQLVHGFDISSLEWRRLLPLLEAAGIEAYAPCVPGWGFSETTAMRGIGVPERRAALLEFHQTVLGGRPAVWGGASLGACIALDCYLEKPDAFKGFAAFDPAFFTDPPPVVPAAVGKFLLSVGISKPGVRASIAKAAYYVKEDQTEDAIRCGNLPLSRAQWSDDQLVWLLGGAYGDQSPLVPKLQDLDTLTLWGREDEVIPPAGIASQWPAGRLMNALPETTFRWVEASGHTPHLEQPKVVAEALTAFVRGEPVPGDSDTESVAAAARRWETVTAAVEKVRVGAQDRLGEAFQKAKAAAADAAAGK